MPLTIDVLMVQVLASLVPVGVLIVLAFVIREAIRDFKNPRRFMRDSTWSSPREYGAFRFIMVFAVVACTVVGCFFVWVLWRIWTPFLVVQG